MQVLTPRVSEVRKLLLSLDICQHNALEIFAIKNNNFSEIRKVLLNDIFAEFNGNSRIKNIITDRLTLGELYVDDISAKITAESTKKCIPVR